MSTRTLQHAVRAEGAGIGEHVRTGDISAKSADQIVSTGLDEAVREGRISPQEAATVARSKAKSEKRSVVLEPGTREHIDGLTAELDAEEDELKPSKKPSRIERLDADLATMKMALQEAMALCENYEQEISFLRGESSDLDHEREETFNEQRAKIAALQSSLYEEQTRSTDWQRKAKSLIGQKTAVEKKLEQTAKEREEFREQVEVLKGSMNPLENV